MKKLLLLTCVLMILCSVALAEIPETINLDGYKPITNKKTTVSIVFKDGALNTTTQEEKWFWQYADKYLNIDFATEGIIDASSERLTLMFASDELPDVLWGFKFSPNQLTLYGQVDRQLMALEDYITPELTPALYALKEEIPEVFAAATAPDGHLYTIPNMTYIDTLYSTVCMIRQDWLSEVNMESPTTLDQFVEMLYAFKDAAIAGEKTVPMGGNQTQMLLHALGFDGGGNGLEPALLKGECVIPAGNKLFLEYLKLMNQFYTDGIIHQDYYTRTDVQNKALLEEGCVGVYSSFPPDFKNWWCMQPLTSQWSETPVWTGPDYYQIGNFVMSSKCESPETIMRFVDYMYTDEGAIYSSFGPPMNADEDILMGVGGYYIADDDNRSFCYVDYDDAENHGGYEGHYDYRVKKIICFTMDCVMDRRSIEAKRQSVGGYEATGAEFNMEQQDRYCRKSNLEVVAPYYTSGYPSIVWMSEEDSLAIMDLKVVIRNYVTQQVAKFITGARPLDEFDNYLQELDKLGFQEYQQYYVDAYAVYSGNM
jgi:putative aldouronate transport system substrate-binding protein